MVGPSDATIPDAGPPTLVETRPTHGASESTIEPVDPLVGARLGDYRIDGILGRGGMGVVYRGWDVRLERPVAIKTLRFDAPAARVRFHHEARLQARLRHRNVVAVHSAGEHGGLSFLVMDYVTGETLMSLLSRRGSLPEDEALEIADGIAAALEAALARNLIHRDVKPANVLVELDGHALLADFGIAKEVLGEDVHEAGPPGSRPPRSLTVPGGKVGTPAYWAPEQALGSDVDHRADMYALGVTLHEMLSGFRPEPGEPIGLAAASGATRAIVERLLARDADARFDTYGELREALAHARAAKHDAAPLATRAVAFVADYLACGAVWALLSTALLMVLRVTSATTMAPATYEHVRTGVKLMTLPIAQVLFGWLEARFSTTPGKRLLGLQTVDAHTGRQPSTPRLVVRSLVRMLPLTVALGARLLGAPTILVWFPAALLGAPALRSARTAAHDLVSRTRVVVARPRAKKVAS